MKLLAVNVSHLNTSVHICQNELCSLKSRTKVNKERSKNKTVDLWFLQFKLESIVIFCFCCLFFLSPHGHLKLSKVCN